MENFYKTEYETTDISIEDLCSKYNITTEDIPQHDSWVKSSDIILVPDTQDIIDIVPDVSSNKVLLDDIQQFKASTLKIAKDRISNEGFTIDTKEMKDLVSIVDTIEKSIVDKKDTGATVNILVQNIQSRFKDDC